MEPVIISTTAVMLYLVVGFYIVLRTPALFQNISKRGQ